MEMLGMVLNDQKPLPGLFLDDTIDHQNSV